jgi:two-component system, OmpR family, alkaline phosphatase synthesis response regulator PhoP
MLGRLRVEILIVEDEVEIAQLLKLFLEKEGFTCFHCRDGITALREVQERSPDLVILDLMLPGLDGLEVCARIRQKPGIKDPYILVLTAKGEEIDRIIGFSTGADAYMVKPFSPKELVAQVRALLRRSLRQTHVGALAQDYRTAHFQVAKDRHVAHRLGATGEWESLDLTGLEFKLLATFVSAPGRAWSRSQLIEQLWGGDFFGDERVVDTHIARLRKKTEIDPSSPIFIKTVVGVGYKFEDEGA